MHGNFVVGIDIQGDTEGLEIIGNTINLNDTVADNSMDKFVALIVGENADAGGLNSTIFIANNLFAHEQLIQNTMTSRNRNLRSRRDDDNGEHYQARRIGEWQIRPHGHRMLNEIDIQNMGGCPFA